MNELTPFQQGALLLLHAALRATRTSNTATDDTERAALLVLSDDRSASSVEELARKARQDAGRTRRRRAQGMVTVPLDEAAGDAPAEHGFEELLGARDFVWRLRHRTSCVHPDCAACLDAWLADEPVEETAEELRVSVRRVKYLRALVRATAREMAA